MVKYIGKLICLNSNHFFFNFKAVYVAWLGMRYGFQERLSPVALLLNGREAGSVSVISDGICRLH